MILMTDGANSKSKTGLTHDGASKSSASKITSNLCTNIKNSDIEIYTIAYEITDSATKKLMRKCATDTAYYFNASNSAELDAAFQSIAANLIKLRLTH